MSNNCMYFLIYKIFKSIKRYEQKFLLIIIFKDISYA